jgi:hypothetical protein
VGRLFGSPERDQPLPERRLGLLDWRRVRRQDPDRQIGPADHRVGVRRVVEGQAVRDALAVVHELSKEWPQERAVPRRDLG